MRLSYTFQNQYGSLYVFRDPAFFFVEFHVYLKTQSNTCSTLRHWPTTHSVIKPQPTLQQHSRYSSGNLVFASPRVLLSPSSNRVLKIDLVKHITTTLPFSARSDIVFITYSPHTKFLLVVSSDSRVILADIRGVVFRRLNFSSKNTNSPLIATFSPSGKHVLISVNNKIHLYSIHSPLRPLDLVRVYSGHYAPVTSLCFSPDGKFFASGSFDSTVRIYSTSPIEHFRPITLSSHKTPIVSLRYVYGVLSIYHTHSNSKHQQLQHKLLLVHGIAWWFLLHLELALVFRSLEFKTKALSSTRSFDDTILCVHG